MDAPVRRWGASYASDTVKAMIAAFDECWRTIRIHFHETPESFETARMRLADAILIAAADDNREIERLKKAGLSAIAVHYRLELADFDLEATMPQRVNNPKYWQSYAEETRTIAERMTDPECRRLLLGVAQTYAELARRALTAAEGQQAKKASVQSLKAESAKPQAVPGTRSQ